MDDEHGIVSPVSGDAVQELPLSVNLPNETLEENLGSENQNQVDVEEIMVDVMGSDVFVDGVCGNNGDDPLAGEVSYLDSDLLDGNKLVESDKEEITETRGEKNYVASEEVAVMSVDGSSGEVGKTIVAVATVDSITLHTDEDGKASVVVIEETAIKDKAVDGNTPGLLNSPIGDFDLSDTTVDESAPVVVNEERQTKDEAVDGNTPDFFNNLVVDFVVGEVDLAIAAPSCEVGKTLTAGPSENETSPDGDCDKDATVVDEKEVLEQDIPQSDIHDENEVCLNKLKTHEVDGASNEKPLVTEKEEVMGMDFDEEVLKFEDSVLETDTMSNEPIHELAESGDIASLEKDEGFKIDTQAAGIEENLANTTGSSSPGYQEVLRAGSDMHMDQVTSDNNMALCQVKILDVDRSGEMYEGIDTESATTENKRLSEEVKSTKIKPLEENNVVSGEVELALVEECGSPHNEELEVSVQKTEIMNDGVYEPEKTELHVSSTTISEVADCSSKNHENHIMEDHIPETKVMDCVEEREFDQSNFHGNEVEESDANTDSLLLNDESLKVLENDAVTEQISDEIAVSHMHKHVPNDNLESIKKERNLTPEMEYSPNGKYELVNRDVSLSSDNKLKALDSLTEESERKVSVCAAKVSNEAPKPSFKIGECIRRVASQLTGSTPLTIGENGVDGSLKIQEYSGRQYIAVSEKSSSMNEMLSQLQFMASDPKKQHIFLDNTVSFFSGFRRSVIVNKRGRKKKVENGSAEEFEFDDVNDSYWTDRIVQNGAGNLQVVQFNREKAIKSGLIKPHSRKRYQWEYPTSAAEVDQSVKRQKQDSSPAELILNFAEKNCVPSEMNLNKMFRRFGPLMESETEVDHDSGRAKMIFKRGSDAEVAYNSAEKFKIFGPVLVSYQIGYSPLISVKILPLAIPQS